MRLCFIADRSTEHGPLGELLRGVARVRHGHRHDVGPVPSRAALRDRRCRFEAGSAASRWVFVKSLLRRVHPDVLIGYRIQSSASAPYIGLRPLVLARNRRRSSGRRQSVAIACVRFALRRADLLQPRARTSAAEWRISARTVEDPRAASRRGRRPVQAPDAPERPHPDRTRAPRGLPSCDAPDRVQGGRERVPSARLVIAGDGAEREKLTRLRPAPRRERSFFWDTSIRRRSRPSCAAAFCSSPEGVSSSLLEAMGGLVPIVPDLPGNREAGLPAGEWPDRPPRRVGRSGRIAPARAFWTTRCTGPHSRPTWVWSRAPAGHANMRRMESPTSPRGTDRCDRKDGSSSTGAPRDRISCERRPASVHAD
jgi:hypothetical protein